jgi:hypothetical protein
MDEKILQLEIKAIRKTREINEEKSMRLGKYTSALDKHRAKVEMEYKQERSKLAEELRDIHTKTPSLNDLDRRHSKRDKKVKGIPSVCVMPNYGSSDNLLLDPQLTSPNFYGPKTINRLYENVVKSQSISRSLNDLRKMADGREHSAGPVKINAASYDDLKHAMIVLKNTPHASTVEEALRAAVPDTLSLARLPNHCSNESIGDTATPPIVRKSVPEIKVARSGKVRHKVI